MEKREEKEMTDKLKACPFCGGPAVTSYPREVDIPYITCGMPQRLGEDRCAGKGILVENWLWNTRPTETAVTDSSYHWQFIQVKGLEQQYHDWISGKVPVTDDALREAVEGGMPCVSCGKPSHRQTPDDADMCYECFGDFNATEYDLIKSEKLKLEDRIKELAFESMQFRIEVINLKDLLKRASPYLSYTKVGTRIQKEIETLITNAIKGESK